MKLESEKFPCKYVFNVKAKNKHTNQEKVFKYACIADCYTAAMIKVMNMIKVDPKLEFVSAELKERKLV